MWPRPSRTRNAVYRASVRGGRVGQNGFVRVSDYVTARILVLGLPLSGALVCLIPKMVRTGTVRDYSLFAHPPHPDLIVWRRSRQWNTVGRPKSRAHAASPASRWDEALIGRRETAQLRGPEGGQEAPRRAHAFASMNDCFLLWPRGAVRARKPGKLIEVTRALVAVVNSDMLRCMPSSSARDWEPRGLECELWARGDGH